MTLVADAPQVLLVRKDLPANNLKEFAAYAKANQDKMQHGSGGAGTSSHIGCVLLNQVIGVNVTHVPYRGGGPALQDLIAGRIDYICNYISTAIRLAPGRHGQGDRGADRQAHGVVPRRADRQGAGLRRTSTSRPGTRSSCRRTRRRPMVAKLNAAISKALDNPALKERLEKIGLEVPEPARRTPEYLQAVRRERDQALGSAGEGERRDVID